MDMKAPHRGRNVCKATAHPGAGVKDMLLDSRWTAIIFRDLRNRMGIDPESTHADRSRERHGKRRSRPCGNALVAVEVHLSDQVQPIAYVFKKHWKSLALSAGLPVLWSRLA